MSEEFQRLVYERGNSLRSKSRIELLELTACPTEKVEIDGRTGTVDIIVEEEPEGSLRVVVQGFIETKWLRWAGVKNVALDGFRIDSDSKLSPLGDKEFYEFD